MWKMVLTNTVIPAFSICISILLLLKQNGERLLSIKYRLWIYDYGIFILLAQIIILIITFFVWKQKKYRLIAILIFIFWILINLLIPESGGLYD